MTNLTILTYSIILSTDKDYIFFDDSMINDIKKHQLIDKLVFFIYTSIVASNCLLMACATS